MWREQITVKFLGAPCGRSNRHSAGKIIGNFTEEKGTTYLCDHDGLVNSEASKHHRFHRKDRKPVLVHRASAIHIEHYRYLLPRLHHR